MTQKTICNIDSNQVITQWFESTVDFVDFFGLTFTQFRWPFLDIRFKCLHSNQLMTQAVSRRLESIQPMTQAAFQELTQNQLMTQVNSPGTYWFKLTRDLKCFPIFRFKSTHDSSEKHLILSRLMVRLWVIPLSDNMLHLLWRSRWQRRWRRRQDGGD